MWPAAVQALVGTGTAAQAAAPGCRAPAGHHQGTRSRPATERLADGGLARREPGRAERALRRRARPPIAPRLLARRAAPRGMAADRMAGGEEGADQILAFHPGRDDPPRGIGRDRQDALAD